MSLIVEDGSGTDPGANSYASITDAALFFEARGHVVNGDHGALLLRAMDLLNSLHYCGKKTSTDQALPFPRTGITDPDGTAYADDAIPPCVIRAQFWLALYINDGHDPGSVTADRPIKREQVGEISQEYAIKDAEANGPIQAASLERLPLAFNEIRHLVKNAGALSGNSDSTNSLNRRLRSGGLIRA